MFSVRHSDQIKRHQLDTTSDTFAIESWMRLKNRDHGSELNRSISCSREQETHRHGLWDGQEEVSLILKVDITVPSVNLITWEELFQKPI